MKKLLKQNHAELSNRLWSMAQAIRLTDGAKITPERLSAAQDLEYRSNEHAHQAMLFGESFLMKV